MRLLILAAMLFTFGCSTPRIAISDMNLNSTAMKVDGRKGLFTKEKMKFGNYHTTSVKRSWTRGTSSRSGWYTGFDANNTLDNVISTEYMRKKQTVRFEMADDSSNKSEVYCVSRFKSEDLQIGNRPNSIVNIAAEIFLKTDMSESNYYIQLYTNQYPKAWELILDNELTQQKPREYRGLFAMDKENYYTLKPVTEMLDKNNKASRILFGSIGYEILNKQNIPVAAVSIFNKGIVYLADLPAHEKFLLANLCAAILMQEQLG